MVAVSQISQISQILRAHALALLNQLQKIVLSGVLVDHYKLKVVLSGRTHMEILRVRQYSRVTKKIKKIVHRILLYPVA